MEQIIPKKEWSVAIRWNHWIMAVAIFVLIITGFFIAEGVPLTSEYGINEMTQALFYHVIFGFILMAVFIWRIYLAFFSRFHADWLDFFAWTNIKNTIKQIKFYLLISKEPPEHTHLYGPLQSLAYGGLIGMVFLILITGLLLTGGTGYHGGITAILYKMLKPVETLMGGLAGVRFIHHILTWCFVLFIAVHIYMAFWYDVIFKQGTVSSMISGVVFRKSHE